MGSISRGFPSRESQLGVVRQDHQLLVLPVVSFFCSLVVIAVFAAGALGIGISADGESVSPALYVLGFVLYVALAFVTIFFNAAIVGTAMKRLNGEDASIKDGLALARQHLGKIFVWALITATVGMILRTLQDRAGIVGRIVIGLIGVAWNVITFFVVPVLLYEPVGVPEAIERSASIFRQRWGEQFIGTATIGLAIFLVAIPVVLVGGAVAYAVPLVGVPLLVIAIGALMAVGAACSGCSTPRCIASRRPVRHPACSRSRIYNGSFRPKKGFLGKDASGSATGGMGSGLPPAPPQDVPPTRPDAG